METYRHKYAAIYADLETASRALTVVKNLHPVTSGIRCYLLGPGDPDLEIKLEPDSSEVAHTLVRDAEIGGMAGLTTAAGGVVLGTVKLTLFISHPVLTSLVVLGYGTAIGGTTGAIVGLRVKEDLFIGTLRDTLAAGHWVVIVHAADAAAGKHVARTLEFTFAESRTHN